MFKNLFKGKTPQVSDTYLADITGKLDSPDFNDFLNEGLINLLPDKLKQYKLDIDKATDDGIHSYLCHLDKLPQGKDCDTAKGIDKREQDRYIGYVNVIGQNPMLMYRVNGKIEYNIRGNSKTVELGSGDSKFIGNNLQRGNHAASLRDQGKKAFIANGTYKYKNVSDNRDREPGDKRFNDAVNGDPNGDQSIGDRAVLFNADGSVIKGADNIRNESIPLELSADSAGESINNGDIPKKIEKEKPKETKKHPNKKKVGATNDVLGGIAALGGFVALVAVIAALVPVVFILDVITFFTAITTMITNVSNMATTFFSITDALLALMGIKGATGTITKFINEMMDNVFGKENVQEGKNVFAKAVNSISVGVKVAERVVAARNSTDSKVEGIAFQLGTVNNAFSEAGLIPPELMATSQSIDTLVSKQDEDFKDELTKITSEIQTQDESKQELKDEQKVIKDKQDKELKEIEQLKGLIDPLRSDVSKVKASNF